MSNTVVSSRRLPRGPLTAALAGLLAIAAAPAAAQTLQSGHYWNPDESGWGAVVTDQGNVIGLHWYTLDHDGEPTWFMAATTAQADGRWSGDLLRIGGVPFAQIAGQASDPPQTIGTASLQFVDGELEFAYTADGSSATRTLQRFNYNGRDAICSAAPSASRASATNYTDHWWNPGQSGWGMQVTHIDDAVYITWYTYDDDREALYFNGVGSRQADGSFVGTLYRTRDGTPYTDIDGAPATTGADEAGSFTLGFGDGETGTFGYTVGNVTQSRPITRLQFGGTAAVCESIDWQAPAANGGGGAQGQECFPPFRAGDERSFRLTTDSGTPTIKHDLIVGQGSFEGQTAWIEEETSDGVLVGKNYHAIETGDEIATFGSDAYSGGVLQARTVNDPIRIAQPRFFTPGQVFEETWTGRSTTAQGFSATETITARWTMVGIETVVTPAGTFSACKFDTLRDVRGVHVRSISTGTQWSTGQWGPVKDVQHTTLSGAVSVTRDTVEELLSATRNGQSTR